MNILFINLSKIFILLIPFCLVIGPAVADIVLSLSSILFVIYTIINKKYFIYNNKIFILFIIFCSYIIILSLFSINPSLSLESSLFYFRFGIFCLFFIYIIKNSPDILEFLFITLLLLFTILFVDTIIQYTFKRNILGFPLFRGEYRVTSFFNEELKLGSFVIRFLPILIATSYIYSLKKLNKYRDFIILFILFLSFILIYLTGERVSLFYYLLFITLFFIFTKFELELINKNKNKIFLLFVICVSIFIFLNENLYQRFIQYTFFQFSQNNDFHIFSIQHEVVYITASKIFLDNPIFGVGPKIFREICSFDNYPTLTLLDKSVNGCQTHPHNTYLQLLTETGIVGFLFIFTFFCFISYKIFQHCYSVIFLKQYKYSNIYFIILLAVFINLFPFVPNGNFFNNWLSIIYFFPISILIWYTEEGKK